MAAPPCEPRLEIEDASGTLSINALQSSAGMHIAAWVYCGRKGLAHDRQQAAGSE